MSQFREFPALKGTPWFITRERDTGHTSLIRNSLPLGLCLQSAGRANVRPYEALGQLGQDEPASG